MRCPHSEKQAHQSFAAAMKARDSLEAVDGIDLGLRPYRCECGSWHLGHKFKTPPWFGRRKARRR